MQVHSDSDRSLVKRALIGHFGRKLSYIALRLANLIAVQADLGNSYF